MLYLSRLLLNSSDVKFVAFGPSNAYSGVISDTCSDKEYTSSFDGLRRLDVALGVSSVGAVTLTRLDAELHRYISFNQKLSMPSDWQCDSMTIYSSGECAEKVVRDNDYLLVNQSYWTTSFHGYKRSVVWTGQIVGVYKLMNFHDFLKYLSETLGVVVFRYKSIFLFNMDNSFLCELKLSQSDEAKAFYSKLMLATWR